MTTDVLDARTVMINDIMLRRLCDRPAAVVILNDVLAGRATAGSKHNKKSKDFSIKISAKGKEATRLKKDWWK